ncbi:SDR family NAD(P)-dependent oxidoreductase [Arsenicicoccus bolidensis]|uniref:SDR family oxidoreductase n=1 Tax=Arsenicicoccus bolidensis TaxID=229480 RepID=A0ABS9Q459_9MICO|nr:SDR family oxidoreductase [Arsenicicoccus bolidensis]MCG7322653.1 SDR family oxidoreductase [Arsenicicoccus bolidensis]
MARTPFAPRVSLVTGGAAGIGRALAVEIGRRGSRVVIADIDAAAAERTAAELRADGLTVTARGVDVADAAAMDDLVREVVATEGRLDAMVNNAGILVNGPFEEFDDHHWRRALDVNLLGVVNGSRAVLAVMREQGSGTIINTGSLAGLMVSPRMLPYTVSKQAVVAFSRGLALEVAAQGIGVHVFCPAFVDTKLLDEPYDATTHAGDFRRYARTLQPRLTTSETVARRAIRGVEAGSTVIPVGLLAQALWRSDRFLPGLTDRGSRQACERQDRITHEGER